MILRYNPFRPGGLIPPGIFHGRVDELKSIERGLFQASHGNPVHFLIQGERGIGKSSLFYILKFTATGKIKTFSGDNLNFLVASIDLGSSQTQLDIIRAIGRELRSVVSDRQAIKDRAIAFWEWATQWEILGVRYHKTAHEFDPEDAADELVARVASMMRDLEGAVDGLLLLIDEADRPPEAANLGEFCKVFTERLMRNGCSNVVLGLAGLPNVIGKLRASHESAPRVFHTMLLDPLSNEESRAVIRSGLAEANNKNETKTEISEDAIDTLATLSEGYPHFIQQFSYSAFDTDTDDSIDISDVVNGAFAENGALSQLGDKYFSTMYHSKIASDDYRIVLHTMAAHSDDWVSRKAIIEESGLTGTTVTNALNALKARDIIVADDSRKGRGFYRLPTRSFAAWLNAVARVRNRTIRPPEGAIADFLR